jgi:hypothetical protein
MGEGSIRTAKLSAARAQAFRQNFLWQSAASFKLGSPLYGTLLAQAADLLGTGGMLDQVLGPWQGIPASDLPALRWAGALHFLALSGQAPLLARHYPSCAGTPDFSVIWDAIDGLSHQHLDFIQDFMKSPPQTNEVQRSALIVPALHYLAAAMMPARAPTIELLEIGASAGLNQYPDRVAIDFGSFELGSNHPAIRLKAKWYGPALAQADFSIVARSGCDLNPIDIASTQGALRLQSYIWPDQLDRLARLRQAIDALAYDPPQLSQSPASQWLTDRLQQAQSADIRLIFHSYVWIYLPPAERAAIVQAITYAAERTNAGRQLAWLRLEDDEAGHQHLMTVTTWPGGVTRVLAHGSPHGQWLHWRDFDNQLLKTNLNE